MGDNLVEARQFTGLCQGHMSALIGSEVTDASKAVAALEDIQRSAKALRARSILRAAQSAIEEFNGVYSPAQRAGALLTLNKLVCQYTEGLDEIAPVREGKQTLLSAEEVDKWEQVREAFLPLQRFAKAGRETAALSALASLGPFVPGQQAITPSESFELLMPAITDESLRQARETEKSVSVSYATDDILMTSALAEQVQEALIEICQRLVRSSVQAPSYRVNQGLSGAAHIAITAKRRGATFDVLVSCEGPMPSQKILNGPRLDMLRRGGAVCKLSGKDNLVRIDITGLPVSGSEDPVRIYDQALGMRA